MADWQARLAAAEARKKAAEEAITEADQTEIDGRAAVARVNADAEEAERKKRDLDLARRFDALTAANPAGRFEIVTIEKWDDTFIVEYSASAHRKWEREIDANTKAEAHRKKAPFDDAKMSRDYAVAIVVDWNGLTDFDAERPFGPDHRPILKSGPLVSAGGDTGASYVGAPGSRPSTGSAELTAFLTENSAICAPLTGAGVRLSGFIAEARKS